MVSWCAWGQGGGRVRKEEGKKRGEEWVKEGGKKWERDRGRKERDVWECVDEKEEGGGEGMKECLIVSLLKYCRRHLCA